MNDFEMLLRELEGLKEYRDELKKNLQSYRTTITSRIGEQSRGVVQELQKEAPKENALPKLEEGVRFVREQSNASAEVLHRLQERLAGMGGENPDRKALEHMIRDAELERAKADNAVAVWEARYERGKRQLDQLKVLLPARFQADWSWRDGYMEGPHWVLLHHWQGWLEEWAGRPETAGTICEVMTVLSEIFALWSEVYRQGEE